MMNYEEYVENLLEGKMVPLKKKYSEMTMNELNVKIITIEDVDISLKEIKVALEKLKDM